jgi:2-hydroxy-3-keto-5-methylthiopentenyl-1-phosphate phosphatase
MDKVFKVFSDFDGTITLDDVGEKIFWKFADNEKVKQIVSDYLSDKISAKECWIKLFDALEDFNKKEFDEFILSMEVDSHFKDFTRFCSAKNINLFILSDGFDYYIDKILHKEGLTGLNIFYNNLSISEGNKIKLSFPHYDDNCFSSANCKRNHIIDNSGDDEFTVFIGDGKSDIDTAVICDFIFAKNDLLKFCEKERITFYPFKNFNDVQLKMESLLNKKRLKKRRQAELKRRELYTQE